MVLATVISHVKFIHVQALSKYGDFIACRVIVIFLCELINVHQIVFAL